MILYQQCLGFQKSLVIELAEALKEKYRKREELLSTVSLLQEHVHYYQNHLNQIKCENEELEQYRRRCCVRIEGIPLVENETSDEVLGKVMSLMDEAECDIPEVVIDRAHRIGKEHVEKNSKKLSSTEAEISWKTMSKLNLIWQRADILFSLRSLKQLSSQLNAVDYVMVDINNQL